VIVAARDRAHAFGRTDSVANALEAAAVVVSTWLPVKKIGERAA
jgi:hypothetical protein